MTDSLAHLDHAGEERPAVHSDRGAEAGRLMTIGELASATGLTPAAIRFYEEQGLISPRRLGRLRIYDTADLRRLRTILEYRRMGLPVSRIAATLKSAEAQLPAERKRAAAMLADHLRQLEDRLRSLRSEIVRTSSALADVLKASTGSVH